MHSKLCQKSCVGKFSAFIVYSMLSSPHSDSVYIAYSMLQYLGWLVCESIHLSAGSVCVNCLYRYSVLHMTYLPTLYGSMFTQHLLLHYATNNMNTCGFLTTTT